MHGPVLPSRRAPCARGSKAIRITCGMAQTRSSRTFDEYIIPKIWNPCREDYMDENEEVSYEVDTYVPYAGRFCR